MGKYLYISQFDQVIILGEIFIHKSVWPNRNSWEKGGYHGHDRMVVGFATTCAIGTYHHSWQGVLDATLYDKICQWLATGRWFSPGTPVSSTNKTDRHDINEMLLKVTLNTINLNLGENIYMYKDKTISLSCLHFPLS